MSRARGALLSWLVAACSGADGTPASSDVAEMETATSQALAGAADGAEAAVCELPSGGYSEACNGCLAARCCAPIEDCKGDAACGDQLRCIIECQTDDSPTACSTACTADSGVHAGYMAYDDCSFSECLSECWM